MSQEENGPIMIPKLFWNQDCDVESNMVVEIAIYNLSFSLCTTQHVFHCDPPFDPHLPAIMSLRGP